MGRIIGMELQDNPFFRFTHINFMPQAYEWRLKARRYKYETVRSYLKRGGTIKKYNSSGQLIGEISESIYK